MGYRDADDYSLCDEIDPADFEDSSWDDWDDDCNKYGPPVSFWDSCQVPARQRLALRILALDERRERRGLLLLAQRIALLVAQPPDEPPPAWRPPLYVVPPAPLRCLVAHTSSSPPDASDPRLRERVAA